MKSFDEIFDRAAKRKGGEQELLMLSHVELRSTEELAAVPDDRYLSAMTNYVFKAGFVWRVIDNKWGGFEQAFWQFNVQRCAHMSEDDIDTLAKDERIVRNRQKILTVRDNAVMLFELAVKYDGFGKMIAEWPDEDYIGLLALLKKRGSRLGGLSAQYLLRSAGRDAFILSRDGVAALIDAGVVDKAPTGKAALRTVQETYTRWSQESGLSMSQISRILSMSIDAV